LELECSDGSDRPDTIDETDRIYLELECSDGLDGADDADEQMEYISSWSAQMV